MAKSVFGGKWSMLSGEGQIARSHFDDKGQGGTFTTLFVDASALAPTGTCADVRQASLHRDDCVHAFGDDDDQVAEPGLNFDRGVAL